MRHADKLQDHNAYPPRAMRSEQAAAYLSISRSMFLQLVDEGSMPQPVRIKGAVTWDRRDLDAAYDDLKRGDENELQRRLRDLAASD